MLFDRNAELHPVPMSPFNAAPEDILKGTPLDPDLKDSMLDKANDILADMDGY